MGEISLEITSGVACARSKVVPDGIPHLRPFSVTENGELSTADAPRIPRSSIPKSKLRFEVGDILFNNTNSVELVGKSAVFSKPLEASFSNHMTRIRVDRGTAEPGYVHAYLRHLYHRRFFQDRATRWVSQAAFGAAQLKVLDVPLPPLEEQRQIVRLLNKATTIRFRADAAGRLAQDIILAAFLDAFGDPASNPKGWPLVAIGDLVSRIDSGWSPTCGEGAATSDQWGVLKLSAIRSAGFDGSEAKPLIDQTHARPELEVMNGDLLFSRKNTLDLVGTAAIVRSSPGFRMIPDTIFRLVPRDLEAFSAEYLSALINFPTFRPHIRQLASGSAASMPGISKERLRGLRVPMPSWELQTHFAARMRRIEALVQNLRAAALKAEAMTSGLSAEVFG